MVLTETGLAKVFQRIKSFVASQLNSKASAIHTHTSSDITDLPSGYVVDSALSSSSENPVQNKVIKSALDGKLGMNTGGGIVNRSGNGQYLYCQIATITILGSYVNFPIVLEISGRGILFSTVQIVFESGETTDPNLSKFISDSYEYFYIKKIDTSTWAVYVKYTQTWGSVTVHRVSGKGLALPSISCDFTVSDVSEFPSECIQVSSSLATVATSGSYNDLSNKPTIPTVNNATLTIQQNGTTVKTFTANASSNVTANITVPTKVSELTNDSGFLTSHQSLSDYSTKANTVKSLSISGKTITVTPGSGNAYTLTTQDTVYTHPTTAGNKHIPSGGSSGQFLGWSSDGTAKWVNNPNTNTTYSAGTNMSLSGTTFATSSTPSFSNVTVTNNSSNGILFGSYRVYVG